MIVTDFGGVSMACLFSRMMNGGVEEGMYRHLILNSLRYYNQMFKKEYGQMVVACDSRSWRKDAFEYYKANRGTTRAADDKDWPAIFDMISRIREEIQHNIPFKVLRVEEAEADDIIAVLVESTQEFGKNEKVMIVSEDKDFLQLQKYPNVSQYSPMKKKQLKEPNALNYIREHILKGDSSDGVPNILSADDVFVDTEARQTPLRRPLINKYVENWDNLVDVMPESHFRNFQRNQKLIDLSFIPEEITERVMEQNDNYKMAENKKVMNYLIQKRTKNLMEQIEDFFPHTI